MRNFNTLKLSILDEIETTLSVVNPLYYKYPIPNTNDYYYVGANNNVCYQWYCEEIMEPYVKNLKISKFDEQYRDISVLNAIIVEICRGGGSTKIYFYQKGWYCKVQIYGVAIPGKTLDDKKDECIKFFKNLSDNPDLFEKIIKRHNDCCNKIIRNSVLYTEL